MCWCFQFQHRIGIALSLCGNWIDIEFRDHNVNAVIVQKTLEDLLEHMQKAAFRIAVIAQEHSGVFVNGIEYFVVRHFTWKHEEKHIMEC